MPRKARERFYFTRHLRLARETLGFTVGEVARFLGASERTIEDIETGYGGATFHSRGVLSRYLEWVKMEAERQSEERRLEWLSQFQPKKLVPQENDLWK